MWRASRRLLQGRSQAFSLAGRWCHNDRTISSSSSSIQKILGLRREDGNQWERRAPLSPQQVSQLVRDGVKVLIQPSNRRAYPMQEYVTAGAIEKEDLTEASVIMGVKQVSIDALLPDKTYVFFSHTIKAQEANMPLLDAILEKNIRLIDYEKMVDSSGRRLVAFGKYAGVTGMINILQGLGLRLLALGHHTPFMHIGMAHNYRNSGTARQSVRDAGYDIALGNMPKSIGPLTFVFAGAGNVSKGAQEVFRELPHEFVSIENLPKVAKHGALNKVYGCEVDMADNLVRKSDGGFDLQEYFDHPDRYASTFSVKVAPYMSVLINGIYYAPGAPRLVTIPDAKNLLRKQVAPWISDTPGCPQLPHRLLAICDISADPGGSIEFMKECTTINHPFMLYDAEQHVDSESFAGDGVLVCSIDNMPAQLPTEATDFFGSLLLPYTHEILKSDAKTPFSDYDASPIMRDAVITSNGELTPNFQYIADLRQKNRDCKLAKIRVQESQKKVLILGAGYVSAPVVDYLTRDDTVHVTVAAPIKEQIAHLANSFPNTSPVLLDVESTDEVEQLINNHDLVVSLLPYTLHPTIAKMCVKHKTNMVTASYMSPAMQELDKAAREAGILVMNEVGVDPGIDHMLAMECFDEVKVHGGKVTSFVSWCGGLPAPEDADNPLRYKFSWSPRGVLFNITSGARWLENKEVVNVKPEGHLLEAVRTMDFLPGFSLEGFPNRDSTIYGSLYGIESAHTLLRGTLRYKGFSTAAKGLLQLGLINPNPHPALHPGGPDITWRELLCELLGEKRTILVHSLRDLIHQKLDHDLVKLEAIVRLGLLDDVLVDKQGSPLDTLSSYLSKRLSFGAGERDVLLMRHDVGIQWPDNTTETRHIDFIVYGEPGGYSAMAATVGFPTGIAAKMILDGEIQGSGMMLPFAQAVYRPMLKRLEKEGLTARETIEKHGRADDEGIEVTRY